jgi:hypothetical protein
MTKEELMDEEVETSVDVLFQRWRVYLFGAECWPAELNVEEIKNSTKAFLLKAVELRRYN